MKLYNIFTVALIAVGSTLFQSCLKDQTDFFEESPSERMQATLDKARNVLTSSPEGWLFEYFPGKNRQYGGYVYTVKFDEEKASVRSEIAPGKVESSYYKFTNDNGPMLVFDTYNPLMHYFAIPSSGHYQAMDGDYEFIIMDITDDMVTLQGKRTGNTMYLRKLETPADEYVDGVTKMIDNLILNSAEGTIGGENVKMKINSTKRYMEFSWGDDVRAGEEAPATTAGAYYLPTPTGISFPEPVEIKGTELKSLGFDPKTLTYSGEGLSCSGEIAPDFALFSEFEGDFTFTYNKTKKVDVTLVRDLTAKKVYIKGLNDNFDVVGTYDPSTGRVNIVSQQVGSDNDYIYWMCAWQLTTGTVTWSTSAGMHLIKDPENPGTYRFANNENSTYNIEGFLMYYFTGSVGTSPRGNCNGKTKWYVNGSYQIAYLESLVKK